MTGDKQEDKSSVGLAAMQCHTPRPSTNTRCKKRKLETQEVVLPEENEPEESCQDHVANSLPTNEEKSFKSILEQNRRLKNRVISLQAIAKEKKNKLKQVSRKVNKLEQVLEGERAQKQVAKRADGAENDEMDSEVEEDVPEEDEPEDPIYEVEEDDDNSESEEETHVDEESAG